MKKKLKLHILGVLLVGISLMPTVGSSQTYFQNHGTYPSGTPDAFNVKSPGDGTDSWLYQAGWGEGGQTDQCLWLPVLLSETNKDGSLPNGVHCQAQLPQVDGLFWDQSVDRPLLSPYGRRFTFDVRFDVQNGFTTAGANEWAINLIQFWQWSTPWKDSNNQQHVWVNGHPEFMLWVSSGTQGRRYVIKMFTNLANSTTDKSCTEWDFGMSADHSVSLIDGNWHTVSVYGSMSTNSATSCIIVWVDGIELNFDTLTKYFYNSAGQVTSTVVGLAGPGVHITGTGMTSIPDYGDFRPRIGAYAYHSFGSINQFRMFLENVVVSQDNVW